MEYARSKKQPWVDLVSGMYREGVMDLPFSFVLAQRGGRNVLVDTGFMQDEHALRVLTKIRHPDLDFAAANARGDGRSGRTTITDIFITHAHFDHMGSIAEFPKAQIYIQKSELLSWYEAIRAAEALRPSHRDHRSRQYARRARRLDRPPRDA